MNYKCPYKERKFFCTHKRVDGISTSNGRKYCSYEDVLKCPYFLEYYNSLTEEEKMAVDGLKSLTELNEKECDNG